MPQQNSHAVRAQFAAAKAPSQGAALRMEAMLAERRDLTGQPCVIADAGACGITCLFQHEVIKMPRCAEQEKDFVREPMVQAHLHLHGFPVAAVTCVGLTTPFYGQERLDGKHLAPEHMTAPTARDVARFMAAMQKAVTAQAAAHMGYENETPTVREMDDLLHAPAVQRLLSECDEDIETALRDYVEARKDRKPVFLHADITPSNILFNEKKGRIAAFLDFGLCHYGDPAVAMHAVYTHFPRDFADTVAHKYAELTYTPVITRREAVCARVAYELAAVCRITTGKNPTNANTRWLRELLIEYDQMAAAAPVNHNIMRIV